MQTATVAENQYSLAEFQQNLSELVNRVKETGQPLMLTDKGKVEAVVLNAEIYQALLEAVDYAEAVEGIRRGLEDVENGRTSPAAEVLEEIRQRLNIPKP